MASLRYIATSGSAGLDRELRALWEAINGLKTDSGSTLQTVIQQTSGIGGTDQTPVSVEYAAASVGSGVDYAYGDHAHDLASAWDDLRVPMESTKLGGTKDPGYALFKNDGVAPPPASQGVFLYWFDATAEEELYFVCQMPHKWAEGTDVKAHVHWVPAVNGSAGQKASWGLEYTWANIGTTFGNTSIVYGNTHTPAETLVAGRHYLTPVGTLSGTGKTLSSMLVCRIFRNATGAGSSTDDYASDAGLLEFDLHFQVDSLGSRQELTK